MIICLRKDVAWLHIRTNRGRGFARRVKHFGKVFRVEKYTWSRATGGPADYVIKDMWAGPLVLILEHWRQTDA